MPVVLIVLLVRPVLLGIPVLRVLISTTARRYPEKPELEFVANAPAYPGEQCVDRFLRMSTRFYIESEEYSEDERTKGVLVNRQVFTIGPDPILKHVHE